VVQAAFRTPVGASARPLSAWLGAPRSLARGALAGGFRVPGLLVCSPAFLAAAAGKPPPRAASTAPPAGRLAAASRPAMSAADGKRQKTGGAALPFDPTAGDLADKIPAELDRSKMKPLTAVPEGMTPAVLVACGSYSPPTVLHTRIFETARDFFVESRDSLKVDLIGGFISPVHEAYGKKGLAPMPDRIEMVKRSLASSDWVTCDEWETAQREWTRTRLSLDRMHLEVNKGNTSGRDVKVMLLCGADILDSMVTPGVWMESDLHTLLSRGIVCIKRAGSDPEKLINDNDILYKYRQNIYLIREWVENNVSSTAVRRAVKRGMSIKYFVADGVIDYINEKKLYLE